MNSNITDPLPELTTKAAFNKLCFVASNVETAQSARKEFIDRFGNVPLSEADAIIALGGDGLMLETLRQAMDFGTPVYGMNFGSQGFLLNTPTTPQRLSIHLAHAELTTIYPLVAEVYDLEGNSEKALAINEVSLLRASSQAAKIAIYIDGKLRLKELNCDGLMVSTSAGSTAYNLSVQGPILPISAPLLALTPVSPFRPRHWRGAILPNSAKVTLKVLDHQKRPVRAAADNIEFNRISQIIVQEDRNQPITMLFDPGHSLEERILREQFYNGC